jgi:hypothetical protein
LTIVHTCITNFIYRGLITASSSANYFLRLLDGSGSELSGTNYFTSSAYTKEVLECYSSGVFGGASEAQFDPMIMKKFISNPENPNGVLVDLSAEEMHKFNLTQLLMKH